MSFDAWILHSGHAKSLHLVTLGGLLVVSNTDALFAFLSVHQ